MDNIKNEESKINQYSVIQYPTFSFSLVDFYSAAGISPSVSIWGLPGYLGEPAVEDVGSLHSVLGFSG